MTQIVPFAGGRGRKVDQAAEARDVESISGFSAWHADYQYGSDQP